MKHSLFVTCAPQLEPILEAELKELGIPSQMSYRGVFVPEWEWKTIYTINYASRIASRVLLPLLTFKCFDRRSLYRHAMEINWSKFLKDNLTFAIDANVHHKQLKNSLFAAQVLKDAICDQMRQKNGRRPNVDVQQPDVQLNLYIQQQSGVISLDTSGTPLHKRGYRQEAVEAPIQESLAAAILRLAHYTGEERLLDPCCGSGTFLIEAALMSTNTPPGFLRTRWGFMRHPDFNSIEWLKVRNQLDAHRRELKPDTILGCDRSQAAVLATKINLRAAGFSQQIDIQQADFREFNPSITPTMIVANPPHGKRLEDEDQLRPLYRSLGNFIKQTCSKPGKAFVFTSNLELTKEVGLSAKKRHVLNNGGLDSRLLEFEIY